MASRLQEFHLATGESFTDAICPPVSSDRATPQACCQTLWAVLGDKFTPTNLATMSTGERAKLAAAFASQFDCEAPSDQQIANALDATLVRWPLDSLDD